jgi:hypothetical protein
MEQAQSPKAVLNPASPVSAEQLAARLRAASAQERFNALMQCVEHQAPVDGCIAELIQCVLHSPKDPLVLQAVAVALGAVTPGRLTPQGQEMLSALCDPAHPDHVRAFAAHGMFRHKVVPASALGRLASMLALPDAPVRQVALLTLTTVMAAAAASIAQVVSAMRPGDWTIEALTALARSAMPSAKHRADVEAYIIRSMQDAPLVPTGIAGYSALAQLRPEGPAVPALARVAAVATEPADWQAALSALTTLGETAQPAAEGLGQALQSMDEPAREEGFCRTLVSVRAKPQDIPIARVLDRIQNGPERSAAAHCMLLCLHAKQFSRGAAVVGQRYGVASGALKPTLEQTYLTLTGQKIGGTSAQRS